MKPRLRAGSLANALFSARMKYRPQISLRDDAGRRPGRATASLHYHAIQRASFIILFRFDIYAAERRSVNADSMRAADDSAARRPPEISADTE